MIIYLIVSAACDDDKRDFQIEEKRGKKKKKLMRKGHTNNKDGDCMMRENVMNKFIYFLMRNATIHALLMGQFTILFHLLMINILIIEREREICIEIEEIERDCINLYFTHFIGKAISRDNFSSCDVEHENCVNSN